MFTIAAALATPGTIVDPGDGVRSVVWARRFELTESIQYGHTANPRPIKSGWLLELEVDPRFMVPRQIGVPVIWIGDSLAVRTHWGSTDCAVVWVPGSVDLSTTRMYFGSTTLPERMDSERRDLDHAAADKVGIGPLDSDALGDVKGESLRISTLQDLMDAASKRSEACLRAK